MHPETSGPAAEAMVHAAVESQIMILFPTGDILGAAVEFGATVASQAQNPDKSVIIVNPFEVRQSVFYVHPGVIAVESLSAIRQMSWY